MPWQGIGGAIADGAFDLLNTTFSGLMGYATDKKLLKKQFEYQKDLQRIQNEYNVYNYQHQNQWRVEDLRSAGLNPILSATNGSSVAPASAGSVGLATSKFHPSNSDRFLRVAMQDALLTSSAKAKSEIALNEASAMERKSAADLNSAKSALETVKGNTAKRVEDMYNSAEQWSRKQGESFGESILNNSFFDKIKATVPGPHRDMMSPDARKHGITYDPERKVFIFRPKGGKE